MEIQMTKRTPVDWLLVMPGQSYLHPIAASLGSPNLAPPIGLFSFLPTNKK